MNLDPQSLVTPNHPLWDKMREECGIFGVFSPKKNIDTFSLMEFGMFALQHRGQEACGLSVLKDGEINTIKKDGLVLDVFKSISNYEEFMGNGAIGHTRYTTAGDRRTVNFQPLYAVNNTNNPVLSLAHNGNLVNDHDLRKELSQSGVKFLATSDSEVILRLIHKYFNFGLEQAIKKTTELIEGAYSILVLTKHSLAAFRDPNGIRPLCYGALEDGGYVFSSETCGLDAVGATYVRDLKPGELIIVDDNGLHFIDYHPNPKKRICAFEYIYFARPDSQIESIDVYETRILGGRKLYEQNPIEADVVIGVPDSGVPAAIGFSEASGIPFQPILVKNRYMSRSFIVPTQKMRERIVNLKLNPILNRIKGKRLVIIDDSIVRGTTSKRLVKILRDAGAKEIHFRSASPPIIAPCFFGIDTPSKKDLISAQMNIPELAKHLGVDSLGFLTVESLKEVLNSDQHCFGCFTEKYPVNPEKKMGLPKSVE